MNIPADRFRPTDDKKVENGIYSTRIEGLYYVAHTTHQDERGFFSELAHVSELEKVIGSHFIVKQVNQARSKVNVVRGIHAEDWNKYVTVTSGVGFVAIVDTRPESITFGNKEYFVLGHADYALDGSLYIPARAGNSICVLEGPIDYVYFVDRLYKDRDLSGDVAISLFDPDISITWPIPRNEMIISERDLKAVTLRDRYPKKFTQVEV